MVAEIAITEPEDEIIIDLAEFEKVLPPIETVLPIKKVQPTKEDLGMMKDKGEKIWTDMGSQTPLCGKCDVS